MGKLLSLIMMLFMAAGAADKVLLKGRLGLSKEFEKGFESMGPLTLSMAGIMCAAPVAGIYLASWLTPLFRLIGADPAMASGIFFGLDMGGYPLAEAMTENDLIRIMGGVVLSSMLGATIVFTIPVSLSLCRTEDKKAISKGIVLGMISIPFGLAAGCAAAKIPLNVFLINAVPAVLISALLAACIVLFQDKTLVCFKAFGEGLQCFCIIALVLASLEEVLGFIVIPGLAPLGEQLKTIGIIGVTLAGAYPFVAVLKRVLAPVLERIGCLLGINTASVTGILASLANPLPFFDLIEDMDERGKVVSMAFAVPAMAVLGDHMGYIAAVRPDAMIPMVVGKLAAGAAGLILAEVFERAPRSGGNVKKMLKTGSEH